MHSKRIGFAIMQLVVALAIPLFAVPALRGAEDHGVAVTGIVGAMDEEIRLIREEMRDAHEERILEIRFLTGTLRGRRVVVAQTGVGKVNAAMITTLVIEHYHPREVRFAGIAGGVNPMLRPGDIVVGTSLVYHDLGDCTREGFIPWSVRNPSDGTRNPISFAADPTLIAAVDRASQLISLSPSGGEDAAGKPRVVKGIIATGDAFIASPVRRSEIRKQFHADAVEMEGAAGAQICHQNKVSFVAIRSISDSADGHANHDMQPFLEIAARNSACLTMKTVELLAEKEKGRQSPPGGS